ncbi:MAG: glycerol-3-phosphate responsive antiterminator [Lachnospiraceae bacterium]|nr:glycerol-3-phosphate responsive antiterminator [Lachnospiraceae bacterium]
MPRRLTEQLEATPVIAAVKNEEGLARALASDIGVVFILYGDLRTIIDIVARVKEQGKLALVHIDLIGGLSGKEISVDYIKEQVQADGILSTHPSLIRHARSIGLLTVLRIFMLDSMSLENVTHQCDLAHPDCVEILPGPMPKVVRRVHELCRVPLIAGGLILDKEDILHALDAGAISVSTTKSALWEV